MLTRPLRSRERARPQRLTPKRQHSAAPPAEAAPSFCSRCPRATGPRTNSSSAPGFLYTVSCRISQCRCYSRRVNVATPLRAGRRKELSTASALQIGSIRTAHKQDGETWKDPGTTAPRQDVQLPCTAAGIGCSGLRRIANADANSCIRLEKYQIHNTAASGRVQTTLSPGQTQLVRLRERIQLHLQFSDSYNGPVPLRCRPRPRRAHALVIC